MKSLSLKDIQGLIGGKIVQGKKKIFIRKAVTRFKRMSDHTLLFDLWGKKKTALPPSLNYHSCAIVTAKPETFTDLGREVTIVEVPNIMKAYWSFVKYYRGLFAIPVFGITGTCGKTTTKDMIRHILKSQYNVQATIRSRNDSIYNFKYLMGIDDSTDCAVIEMGVMYPGDLLRCCKHFSPNIGIITKIGVDHLMGCRSLEGYIKAKSELLEGMSFQGTLIINADDKNIEKIDFAPFKGQIITFGFNKKADFRASHVRYFENGMKYRLHHGGRVYRLFVPGYGEHNVYNALAAIAAVNAMGFDVYKAGQLLNSFQHLVSHVQIRNGPNGCIVIDDTWSTNPTSIKAALEVFKTAARYRRKAIVLGYIDELGEHSDYYHAQVGEEVARLNIDLLVTVGEKAEAIAKAALAKGMKKSKVICCQTPQEVFAAISPVLKKDTVLLVKKSMHVSAKGLMKRILGE